MIRKLRIRFIILSMFSLFALLAGIVTGMNIINYYSVIREADDTLDFLSHNRGRFPDNIGGIRNEMAPDISPEIPYESRYFSVVLDNNGNALQIDTGKIKAVSSERAVEYAEEVLAAGKSQGFADDYRFVYYSEDGQNRIIFLDCGRKLHSFRAFLFTSIGISLAGYLIFFFVILFFSERIIRPAAESYEKQKRFITDAGHEIKTPLAIIKADADVMEMEYGENEWLTDIQKQTQRLTVLTNNLVYLSRMEEAKDSLPMIEFSFSDVVSEAAASFEALAQTQNKFFQCSIQPLLSLKGNEQAIHQLITILLDNALKYSPENGFVSLTLTKQNKTLRLSVFNATKNCIPGESLNLLFERFYRIDSSRSSQTGGYGIGLSIAQAIVSVHGGKIHASTGDGHTLQIDVTFPA